MPRSKKKGDERNHFNRSINRSWIVRGEIHQIHHLGEHDETAHKVSSITTS